MELRVPHMLHLFNIFHENDGKENCAQVLLWPIGGLLVHKKSTKSFAVFGLRLILISCDVKNKQKTTGTGHWVNRLVPKNDIKLL